ncbi:hypothetical protein AB0392_07930 [Nonomuraea angiospora]|uniref:hypothetical protein n=1 Tax=Nonomuraea angiospora TaxID=46172 RepID=UPI003450DBB9
MSDASGAAAPAAEADELPNDTTVQGVVIVAEDRLARRPGDYERFVEAIMYQDGREFADARGTKDLYSEDTESIGLFGAVISKLITPRNVPRLEVIGRDGHCTCSSHSKRDIFSR